MSVMGLDSFSTDGKESGDVNANYTKKGIIESLLELSSELDSTPTMRQAANDDRLPSIRTMRNHFGTWNSLLKEAGLEINERHNNSDAQKNDSVTVFNKESIQNRLDDTKTHNNLGSKQKGDIAELSVTKEFTERGFEVSVPFGDKSRYDSIIDINGQLFTNQVKYARYEDGKLKFRASSKSVNGSKIDYENYVGDVDILTAYSVITDEVYVLNPENIPSSTVTLRLTKPDNNQTSNVRFASQFTLDEWLSSI